MWSNTVYNIIYVVWKLHCFLTVPIETQAARRESQNQSLQWEDPSKPGNNPKKPCIFEIQLLRWSLGDGVLSLDMWYMDVYQSWLASLHGHSTHRITYQKWWSPILALNLQCLRYIIPISSLFSEKTDIMLLVMYPVRSSYSDLKLSAFHVAFWLVLSHCAPIGLLFSISSPRLCHIFWLVIWGWVFQPIVTIFRGINIHWPSEGTYAHDSAIRSCQLRPSSPLAARILMRLPLGPEPSSTTWRWVAGGWAKDGHILGV